MARSFKKHNIIKDSAPGGKRQANRAVRRAKIVQSGSWYKKIFDSWNISDWRWWSKNEKDKRK